MVVSQHQHLLNKVYYYKHNNHFLIAVAETEVPRDALDLAGRNAHIVVRIKAIANLGFDDRQRRKCFLTYMVYVAANGSGSTNLLFFAFFGPQHKRCEPLFHANLDMQVSSH